jgi:hypothetical protein
MMRVHIAPLKKGSPPSSDNGLYLLDICFLLSPFASSSIFFFPWLRIYSSIDAWFAFTSPQSHPLLSSESRNLPFIVL